MTGIFDWIGHFCIRNPVNKGVAGPLKIRIFVLRQIFAHEGVL
jgi:hypothetical protein